jgi:hypothetical protein
MRHWLFNDEETGEDFIVGADTVEEAMDIALEYFAEPVGYGEIDEITAEQSGLDEY